MTNDTPHPLAAHIKESRKLTWEGLGQLLLTRIDNKDGSLPNLTPANVRNFSTGRSNTNWFWPAVASIILEEWESKRSKVSERTQVLSIDKFYAGLFSRGLVSIYNSIYRYQTEPSTQLIAQLYDLLALIQEVINPLQDKYQISFPEIEYEENPNKIPDGPNDEFDYMLRGSKFIKLETFNEKLLFSIQLLKNEPYSGKPSRTKNIFFSFEKHNFTLTGNFILDTEGKVFYELEDLTYLSSPSGRCKPSKKLSSIREEYIGKGFSIACIKQHLNYVFKKFSIDEISGIILPQSNKFNFKKTVLRTNMKPHHVSEIISEYYKRLGT